MTQQSALIRILETSAFIPGALDGNNWGEEARRVIETTRREWNMSILTNEDLKQLTGGLVQGAAQCRWITRELGFKPPVKVDGHPSITWEQVNRGRSTGDKPRTEPRWSVAA